MVAPTLSGRCEVHAGFQRRNEAPGGVVTWRPSRRHQRLLPPGLPMPCLIPALSSLQVMGLLSLPPPRCPSLFPARAQTQGGRARCCRPPAPPHPASRVCPGGGEATVAQGGDRGLPNIVATERGRPGQRAPLPGPPWPPQGRELTPQQLLVHGRGTCFYVTLCCVRRGLDPPGRAPGR